MRFPAHGGVPLLWWTLISVHVAEEHRPTLIKAHAWQRRRGQRTVQLHSCGVPVVKQTRHWRVYTSPAGAQVFALFPQGLETSFFQHLVIPPHRPPPGIDCHRQRVSVAFGGQLRCPRQHRHGERKRRCDEMRKHFIHSAFVIRETYRNMYLRSVAYSLSHYC